MKRNSKVKAIIAALLLFTLTPSVILPSYAESNDYIYVDGADTYLGYSNVLGPQIASDSGVIIESQNITFDFSNSETTSNYGTPQYSARVNTDLVLYNPTDSEITVRLYCPLPSSPYSYSLDADYIAEHSFFINGEPLETPIRYVMNYEDDNIYNVFHKLVQDDYIENDICSTDMVVTKYTFKQFDVKESGAYISFEFKKNDFSDSCCYFDEEDGLFRYSEGKVYYTIAAGLNQYAYDLYVFGPELTDLPEWKIHKGNDPSTGEQIDGKLLLVNKETTTLMDYVMKDYKTEFGVTEIDWFNMEATNITSSIRQNSITFKSVLNIFEEVNYNNYERAWGFVYDVTIGSGQRATTTYIAPCNSYSEVRFDPVVYIYSYRFPRTNLELYSENINLNVITSYYVLDDYRDYEKNENGYSTSIDPKELIEDNKITLCICESEKPKEKMTFESVFLYIILIILIPITIIIEFVKLIIKGVKFVIDKAKGAK